MTKIDIELSAYITVTEEELKLLKKLININPSETVHNLITTGRIELNGGFYFPDSFNNEDFNEETSIGGIEGNIKPMESLKIVKG